MHKYKKKPARCHAGFCEMLDDENRLAADHNGTTVGIRIVDCAAVTIVISKVLLKCFHFSSPFELILTIHTPVLQSKTGVCIVSILPTFHTKLPYLLAPLSTSRFRNFVARAKGSDLYFHTGKAKNAVLYFVGVVTVF